MKKLTFLMALMVALTALASCGKKEECFFCGEEKVCEEITFWDEDVNVCDDCLDELNEIPE